MLHERLRDDPSEWSGLTQAQFASREKARMRDREKKRRQRAREAARAIVVAEQPEHLPRLKVRMMPCGIPAYRVIAEGDNGRGVWRMKISLPYVSILDSAA